MSNAAGKEKLPRENPNEGKQEMSESEPHEQDQVVPESEQQADSLEISKSGEPLVCVTHLHVVEGQVCQQGVDEEEEEKEQKEEKRREKCKFCGETFLSKRELLTHLKNHKRKKLLEDNNEQEDQRERKRSKTEQSPGPLICPNCGSSFNNKNLVTRHQRYIFNGQSDFFC